MNKKNTKKKGFTLIELIVVIAILGILAAVLVPKFAGFQDKARRTQVVTDAKQITTAIDSLLAESASGKITGATVTQANTTDPVVKLSGVTSTFSLTYGDSGTFTLTESINGITYTAKRSTSSGSADITQTP